MRYQFHQMPATDILLKSVTIDAPASAVWAWLTAPNLIQRWMWDTPIEIECD